MTSRVSRLIRLHQPAPGSALLVPVAASIRVSKGRSFFFSLEREYEIHEN